MKRIAAFALLVIMLFTRGYASGYLYMVSVGKGDAIIVSAQGKNYLIDTGKSDAWDTVYGALKQKGIDVLDGVFLTHTDKDHSGGLKKLKKSDIEVKAWYASACYSSEYDKHPLVKALKSSASEIVWLRAGNSVDGMFTVLAPLGYNDDEDDNSLVMMFACDGTKVLLTGDMEGEEEFQLLSSGADLTCDIFKVPNHGDDDVCLSMDFDELGAVYALISTDSEEKPGSPDGLLLWRLEQAGIKTLCTQDYPDGIYIELPLAETEK